jgi:hypothetical protein
MVIFIGGSVEWAAVYRLAAFFIAMGIALA